jgi:hypothetical protein
MTTDLIIKTKKIELIQWLSTTEDLHILDKVMDLITNERKKDWWIETSESEKNSIEKGIEYANNEKLNTHSKAREIYGKWL